MAKELAVRVWRRRPDAQTVFTLDEAAACGWASRGGAPARWLPEPPVPELPATERPPKRSGCAVYGALAARKGIGLLARAFTLEPTSVSLVLAGTPEQAYVPELESHAMAMAASGVDVELRARTHSELEGLRVLASANCALLPYPRHAGMSRVLLEACSVGTPVVADNFGLLGHLVRTHRLGLTVDCANPHALRDAALILADPARSATYAEPLKAFCSRFSPQRFREALSSGLDLA